MQSSPSLVLWISRMLMTDHYLGTRHMHIAAVGWIYVVLMMAITEESVVAAIMTFFLYGVLPVSIIMYVGGTGARKRRRQQEQLQAMQERQQAEPNDTPQAH